MTTDAERIAEIRARIKVLESGLFVNPQFVPYTQDVMFLLSLLDAKNEEKE